MTHADKAGGIILNGNGEIVIVTNHLGRDTFPKGSPEAGESLLETARREIEEETGLTDVEIGPELGIIVRLGYTADNIAEPSVIKHIHIYVCRTRSADLKPQTPDIVRAYWQDRATAHKVLSWPEEADFLAAHQAAIDKYINDN